jgi:hypothetical protein
MKNVPSADKGEESMTLWLMLAAVQALAPAEATPAPVPLATIAPATSMQRIVTAGTIIDLEFVDTASSKTSKSGQLLNLRTVDDVRGTQNELLVPKGSKVVAEVIQASPARIMGKAGELTPAARWIKLDGETIPLKRFRFGQSSGKDNAGTAMIATALIGLPGMFISGGNVDVAPGARANAVVVRDMPLAAADLISSERGK